MRIPSGGISSLEIRGTIGTQGQTTISGGSNSLTRAIRVQGNNPLGSFILRDIILEGHSKPGGIVCYNNIGNVLIENCIIKDFIVPNGIQMSVLHEYYNGIAIQSFAPTTILNSKIFNNQGVWTQDTDYLWDVYGNYYSSMGVVALTFITAPDQLDGNCEIDPNTGVLFRETYLGYYLPESLKPFDALLPILNDIKAILAEDWALVRIPIFGYDPQPGDPPSAYYTDLWLGSYLMNNENLAINHGEMVVVHYIGTNDVEFKLGGDNPNPPFTESYARDMTKHFTYEEQLGYLPVFISMDLNQYEDGNKPTEVALFIDEVCKGAAVIKDGEIQLNAYITNNDDLTDDLKEVEFRLYFPAKSASSIVPEYAVFNLQTGVYESKTARVSDFKGFLRVQLTKTGEIPPPTATQLFQNYPNPFNPVTSIKYDLAENSLVRMDIFNVKGQLVKTLLNQEMLAGTHSVIWDGKDGQGRSVSSGVYFYRMSLPNKVLTNKMLLLK